MVKIDRTPTPPPSLAVEKTKANRSYKKDDVVEQLASDFRGKCYLCEMDELQSIEVEHLRPHHNGRNRDRMFDWNNLFYSCSHCNSVKNRGIYEKNVADCCTIDPETIIRQEFLDGRVVVSNLVDTDEARVTASLVTDCFELSNTPIRTKECQVKVRALQRTMTTLYKALGKYQTEKTERTLRTLKGLLSRSYRFAGFTRTYVRSHIATYPDLAPFVALEES